MRIKKWACSVELLRMILAPMNVIPACRVVLDGWPEDARILKIWVEGDGIMVPQTVWMHLESQTFDDVLETNNIPVMCTTFDRQEDLVAENLAMNPGAGA